MSRSEWALAASLACGVVCGQPVLLPQQSGAVARAAGKAPPATAPGGPGAGEAAPPPVPPAEKGDVQLNGIYLKITSLVMGGRQVFTNTHYYFMPDGHVFYGMPPGGTVHAEPTAADQAALLKANPKFFGTYKVTGDRIAILFGDTPRGQTHKFALQKPGDTSVLVLDGVFAVRYGTFKENQTFDGKYSAGASTVSGGTQARGGGPEIRAASATTLDFHADGTFGQATLSGVDVKGGASTDGRSAAHGKYQFSGNTLTLTFDDGKTRSFTAYPMGDKDGAPLKRMCVGGAVYDRQ